MIGLWGLGDVPFLGLGAGYVVRSARIHQNWHDTSSFLYAYYVTV